MRIKINGEFEIRSDSILVKGSDTGFSIERSSDPEQFNKLIFFYPEHAKSLRDAIEKYIKVRDGLQALKSTHLDQKSL